MKVVLAPQTYKGSISALEVAKAMSEGLRRVVPDAEIDIVPVADGGDGTLETLVETTGGEIRTFEVTGPLGERVTAKWGALGDGLTAVVEMARTSGLALVPESKRDPRITTTRGLGELIKHALDSGFRKFIVGIGGSATNDGGAGMAQALGARLLDRDGMELPPGGAALALLDRIDMSGMDRRVAESQFMVACDVNNPLTGPNGAAAVYGPQKGATPEMVKQLDAALSHFAKIVKRDIGADINDVPGAGAAGGLGGGMIAFCKGELRAGVDIVLDTLKMDDHLDGVDLVITGEGQMDFQTVFSKAPIGVAKRAKERGIAVIAISGSLGKGFTDVHDHGIDAASAIVPSPMTLDMASSRAAELIANATEQAIRYMKVGAKVFGKEHVPSLEHRFSIQEEVALKGYLNRLMGKPNGSFLIVSSGDYFVQFVCVTKEGIPHLHCEAISDEFLEPNNLSDSQRVRLVALGFQEPGTQPSGSFWYDDLLQDDVNFTRAIKLERNPEHQLTEIARMTLHILSDIYGVEPSLDLDYEINFQPV